MSDTNSLDDSWEIQRKASATGFDWPEITGVLDKVREELTEIEDALRDGDITHAQEELGDLLFATVNLARFLDIHPRDALNDANVKFQKRFDQVCAIARERKIDMKVTNLDALDEIWDEVKGAESKEKK
jgi:uncharacterized protein YabN with tetrapyrrole methylase and pyrophosphatase domain